MNLSGLKGILQTRRKIIHRIASPQKGVLLTPFWNSQIPGIEGEFEVFCNEPDKVS